MEGYRKLIKGEQLQVGDILVSKRPLLTLQWPIHRVTKKFAFIRYNDIAEGKYPIEYSDGLFQSVPRQEMNQEVVTIFRKVENE